MENETWLPVAGYENLYEVSSLGRVRSLVSGRVLRPAKNTNGYLVVGLCKNGKHKTHRVHRLLDPTDGRFNRADSKRVYQYDIDGRFVKEWISAAEVQRRTGWFQQSISRCCTGKLKQAYGFRWFYTFQGYKISV